MELTLKEQLEDANRQLTILMENMPGGFMIYDAVTGKFSYLSDGLLSMFGCSEEAFREHFYNSFELLIYKQERKRVLDMITEQFSLMGAAEANFRIKSMLDEVMYVSYKGRRVVARDGKVSVYATLTDVTEQVAAQMELNRMNEALYVETQRFKLLQEALDDIPFDLNVITDEMTLILKRGDMHELRVPAFMQENAYQSFVHPEDCSVYEKNLNLALEEPAKITAECRMRFEGEDEYCWYRVFFASFGEDGGTVLRVVGNMKDIALERARQEEMRNKIRNDSMTGILNKAAMQASIEDYLSGTTRDKLHAMMMIDTDNFKSVNDTMGHLFGDEVIKFVAKTVKQTFRESDFVGRVGGDEFMVFMKNTTRQVTELRAQELNQAMRQRFCKDGASVQISCSIGVAYYPKAGIDFASLFANADEALYQAKAKGKDCYVISQVIASL